MTVTRTLAHHVPTVHETACRYCQRYGRACGRHEPAPTVHYREECDGHESTDGPIGNVVYCHSGQCHRVECGTRGPVLAVSDDVDDITCPECRAALVVDDSDRCDFTLTDGNRDDPSHAYCGHVYGHAGDHGLWQF